MGRSMRRYWYIGVVVVILAIVGGGVARIQWANSIPSRPKDLPATAIWVPAPSAPLDFSPRGYWLACWLDTARNVDRCELTDYKGHPSFEADYSPLAGPNTVPQTRLHLQTVSSTMGLWTKVDKEVFLIVYLQDGTVLVPTENLSQLRQRYASK
jgi:hypothetical protein